MQMSPSGVEIIIPLVVSTFIIVKATKNTSMYVTTDKGIVIGTVLKTSINGIPYAAFKGIPYAKPPLGEKRFQKADEMNSWSNKMEAFYHGSICVQPRNKEVIGSENCLFLNVYTPEIAFDSSSYLRSVMIYIHGGEFIIGSGNSEDYGPDLIVEKDVVLVTFNYRLGAFGFLNLNYEKAPGNAGLKDQVMAMKWVQRNIKRFGGNPNNVTIFGQSAGSVCIDLHSMSDMSRGLFHQSIAMSGSVFNPWAFHTNSVAKEQADKLVKQLNSRKSWWDRIKYTFSLFNTKDKFDVLMQASPNEIIQNTNNIMSFFDYSPAFAPSTEKWHLPGKHFLDECFVNKFRYEKFQSVPHMMGFVDLETWSFRKYIYYDNILAFFGVTGRSKSTIFSSLFHENATLSHIKWNKLKYTSEILFETGIDLKHKLLTSFKENKMNVYYYYFTYDPFKDVNFVKGAGHSDELNYIFYLPEETKSIVNFYNESKFDNQPALVRERTTQLWTNFAKYGDPTYDYNSKKNYFPVKWNKSSKTGGYLEIGDTLKMHSGRPIRSVVEKYQRQQKQNFIQGKCIIGITKAVWNNILSFIQSI